jgi:hypothetical protein
MSEELRRVRDTLIEELRRSDTLTVAGRALYARYAAMSEAQSGVAPPGTEHAPPPPATRPRPAPAEEDDEFGGSFMIRSTSSQPNIPGYYDTPPDVPRSIRDRRR